MKIINIEQKTPEWHAMRSSHIGSTDASVVTETNPYQSKYNLWQMKLGLIPPTVENEAMKRGSLYESDALNVLSERLEISFKPAVLVHSERSFQMSSLDGLSSCSKYIAEVKCPGIKNHEACINGNIPKYWIAQAQHHLSVSELEKCYFASYNPDHEKSFVMHEIYRDDDFIDKMVIAEKEFYRNLMEFTPPELTDRDYVNREDKEWRLYAEVYRETKYRLKEYEKKEADLKLKLIQLSNGASCKGYGVRVGKVVRRGNVDYSSIKELEGVDLSNYRKRNVEYWSVRDE